MGTVIGLEDEVGLQEAKVEGWATRRMIKGREEGPSPKNLIHFEFGHRRAMTAAQPIMMKNKQ